MIHPLPPARDPDARLWTAICIAAVALFLMMAVRVAAALIAGRL